MESLITVFTAKLAAFLSKEAVIFIISVLPVLELRGGLIAASILNVTYLKALIICIIGNILPIPFVLLFIKKIVKWMDTFGPTRKFASFIHKKVEKNKAEIEKYDFWGLTVFVGIPLPGTGAWTGSIVAGMLEMDMKKSFPAIVLGVLMASAIMSFVSYGMLGALIH